MIFQRFTIAVGATLGALALALAPTAANAVQAASLTVGTNTTGTYTWTGVGKTGGVQADIPGYGTVTCTSATAGGTVTAGAPVPSPWAAVTALSLSCPSIIPGFGVTISLAPASKCAGAIQISGADGTSPFTTTTGTADFGNGISGNSREGCVDVNFAGVCSFQLYGAVNTTFTETTKPGPPVSQQLTLNGQLTMTKVSGILCPSSIVANGKVITLRVPLDISSTSGLLNFS